MLLLWEFYTCFDLIHNQLYSCFFFFAHPILCHFLILEDLFVLHKYSWVCGLLLEYYWLTRGLPLWENCHSISPHPSVANSCSVGVGVCASLHGSCAYCLNLWDFLCISSLICPKECFLVVIHNLSLTLFLPDLLQWSLDLGRGVAVYVFPLRMSILQSLILCALASCGSLCYSPFTGNRNFLDEGWEMYGYKDKSFKWDF